MRASVWSSEALKWPQESPLWPTEPQVLEGPGLAP